MSPTAPQSPNIGELIKRFQVCWDVWPEYTFINHEKRQIGFELDLAGTHEDGSEHAAPGCEKCREIYRALIQIAEDVLPSEDKDTTHQIEPYDQGIHYSPRRGNRPEVILRIRILHRKAFDSPVEEPQLRYLKELQQRLEVRGASQR